MKGLVERDFRDAAQMFCGVFTPCCDEGRELLHRILLQTDRLAPTDKRGTRQLWLAVPTGKNGDALAWFYLWTRHEDGYKVESVNFINYTSGGGFIIESNSITPNGGIPWAANAFLGRLLQELRRIIDDICRDASRYNSFIENNLPRQYRSGRIRRSRLYECAPFLRLNLADRQADYVRVVQFERWVDPGDEQDFGGQIVLPFLDARLDRFRHFADGWTKESLEAVIASVEWDPVDVFPK